METARAETGVEMAGAGAGVAMVGLRLVGDDVSRQ